MDTSPQKKQQEITGVLLAVFTACVWAGWMMMTRLGVTSSLSPVDIAFLRFGSAGLILLPVAWRNRKLVREAPKLPLLALVLCGGLAYILLMAVAFRHASAAHGIMTPGTIPVFVAVLSWFIFRDRFTWPRIAGYALILGGVGVKISASSSESLTMLAADLFFLGGALCMAVYTVIHRALGFSALVTTAFICTGSMLLGIIPYMLYQCFNPHFLPLKDAVVQMLYQGLLTSVISQMAYVRAVGLIGSARASAFVALVPVLAVALAIPVLGEYPTGGDMLFVAVLSGGVLLASGVFLRWRI